VPSIVSAVCAFRCMRLSGICTELRTIIVVLISRNQAASCTNNTLVHRQKRRTNNGDTLMTGGQGGQHDWHCLGCRDLINDSTGTACK
jgi:hypothetical protein